MIKEKQFNIRISLDFKKELEKRAKEQNRNISCLAREILYLNLGNPFIPKMPQIIDRYGFSKKEIEEKMRGVFLCLGGELALMIDKVIVDVKNGNFFSFYLSDVIGVQLTESRVKRISSAIIACFGYHSDLYFYYKNHEYCYDFCGESGDNDNLIFGDQV
jgi:hypothetical protein